MNAYASFTELGVVYTSKRDARLDEIKLYSMTFPEVQMIQPSNFPYSEKLVQ